MKIVHIAGGTVSGSPIRIVDAINKYTPHDAFFVNTMHEDKRTFFDLGIDWRTQKEEAMEHFRSADIVHAHSRGSLEVLGPELKPDCPVLLHNHGSPEKAQYAGRVIPGDESLFHASIVQYPERYIPYSRLLPNIINFGDKVEDAVLEDACARIFYSPTMKTSAWRVPEKWKRWITKGRKEISRILFRMESRLLTQGRSVELNYLIQSSFKECMQAKRASNIVVDDTVTGSYHLVGLEGLAMGVPVIGYIDSRIEYLLKSVTGAESIPWVNVHLEELEATLEVLINDGALRKSIGNASHEWMKKYYQEEVLVQHFSKAYEDLLEGPDVFSKDRFDVSKKRDLWFVRDSYDAQYLSRKRKQQRGVELLLSSPYVNSIAAALPNNNLVADLWVQQEGYSMGSWLYHNRHRRIDGNSELFFEGRRQGMLDRYQMAFPYSKESRVAILGSGVGYGAKLLKEAGAATSVVGVEKDMLSVAYAQQEYSCDGVTYLQKGVLSSGLEECSFDLVVAIDLIESVDCDALLFAECKRLLAPGGVCVISGGDLWDEGVELLYQRRYTPRSFRNALMGAFDSVTLYRQPSIGWQGSAPFVLDRYPAPLKEGESLLAICKNSF